MSHTGSIKTSLTTGFKFDYDYSRLFEILIRTGYFIDEPRQQKDGNYEFVYYSDDYFDQNEFSDSCEEFMFELVDILIDHDPDQEKYEKWFEDHNLGEDGNPKPVFRLVINGTFYNEGSGGNYVDKATYTAFVEDGVFLDWDYTVDSGYKE